MQRNRSSKENSIISALSGGPVVRVNEIGLGGLAP